jgi:hypothetical protein
MTSSNIYEIKPTILNSSIPPVTSSINYQTSTNINQTPSITPYSGFTYSFGQSSDQTFSFKGGASSSG